MSHPDETTQPDPRFQTARKRLESLLAFQAQDPGNGSLAADVFDAALVVGAFEEAGRQVALALARDPGDVAWLHREGSLLLAKGEYPRAREAYLALRTMAPEDPVFCYNLAFAQFALRAMREASDLLVPLLEEVSGLAELAWPLWLRCQHHLGRIEEGLAAFSEATTSRLMGAEAWGVASLMAIDAERLEEARAWSEQALRAQPTQMEALAARGSLALGDQDAPTARASFDRAIALNPKDGRSWSGLAFALMLQGAFPAALEAFRRALEEMPGHIGTWIGLGWCEFLSGNLDAARVAFEQALSLDRNFGESHGALAVVLARQAQEAEARAEISLALKLDPLSLSARYAEALLRGETSDLAAFQRMAYQALSKVPAKGGRSGLTLADLVFKQR